MKHSILTLALLATFGLAACDNRPEVIYVPPAAGPAGPAGPTGATGNPGEPGKPGDSTTVIVVPPAASVPASAPAN